MEDESPYLLIDPEWEEVIHNWNQKKLTCTRCGHLFYEIDNIGHWKCSQHVRESIYFRARNGYSWPCCGKRAKVINTPAYNGCVKADHTTLSINFDEYHDIPIPRKLEDYIVLKRQSVVIEDETEDLADDNDLFERFIIRRFDWKKAEQLGSLDLISVANMKF